MHDDMDNEFGQAEQEMTNDPCIACRDDAAAEEKSPDCEGCVHNENEPSNI